MKKLVLIVLCLAMSCGLVQAQTISATGSLATVAATLTPGQWGEVTGMTGLLNSQNSGVTILNEIPRPEFYGGSGDDDSMLSFMDKGRWNPATHELYIYGGAHNTVCTSSFDGTETACEKQFVKFNADTGHWSNLPMPPDACGLDWGGSSGFIVTGKRNNGQHYYDYNSIDTVNQIFYIHDCSNSYAGEFHGMPFDIKTQTWGRTAAHDFAQNAFTNDTLDSYEFFPDIRRLVHINSNAIETGGVNFGVATQYDYSGDVWTFFNGSTFANPPGAGNQGYKLQMGANYSISRYDNQHHVLYFGGGTFKGGVTTSTNQLYQYRPYNGTTCNQGVASGADAYSTGCTTALPTAGAPAIISMRAGIQDIDPVTGDLVIFVDNGTTTSGSFLKYTYHNGDSSWNVTDISPGGHSLLWNPLDNTYPMFNVISASVPDDSTYQGVLLFVNHISLTEAHVYAYKNAQRPSLSTKCALPGVLNCRNFNSAASIDSAGNSIKYNWDSSNSNLNNDPLLCVTFVGPTCTVSKTNYPITGWRDTGEGCCKAYNLFDTPNNTVNTIAQIDPTTAFEGGGALKIPMGQYNGEETAYYYDNLNGALGHPNVAICNNITNCPQGNTIWAQAMVRFSDAMINDYVFECSLQLAGSCYNSSTVTDHGVHTTTLDCTTCTSGGYLVSFCSGVNNPSGCPTSHQGKRIFIYNDTSGTNCIAGIYTITAVNTYNQVGLDRSPSTIGNKCSGGTVLVENLGQGAQPWKLMLLVTNALPVGAAPNGSPTGNCECEGEVLTGLQNFSPGFPQVYDSKGHNNPSNQFNYRFLANTWHELTEEVIVGNFNSGENRTDAEVKWWVDGNLAFDWPGAQLDLSGGNNGYGLGQIQLETYQTKRDSFYAGSVPSGGLTWWDNVITSTQPIPFNRNAGGSVVACSSPSKVVFLSQPASAFVNATLGTVVAQIEDSSGVFCTTATNTVSLVPHSGATWATLQSSSSLTKAASGGVVSWNDLFISPTPGSGSIDANSSGLTSAISNSINITSNTACSGASKVVITSQPSDAQLGANIGTVTAEIQDSSGVKCNTATNSVALSKHSGVTWGTLTSTSNPTLTKNATAGVVSWSDLSVITTTGSGAIDIGSSGLTGTTTNSINITVVVPGGGGNLRRRRP